VAGGSRWRLAALLPTSRESLVTKRSEGEAWLAAHAGGWRLAAGGWRLGVGGWQLAALPQVLESRL
jgi:hypothetical protein